MKGIVCNVLQIYKEALTGKYMGLLTNVGHEISGILNIYEIKSRVGFKVGADEELAVWEGR